MIVNLANITLLFRGFSAIFKETFAALTPTSLYQRVATIVPSTTRQNDYSWLGKFPKMREWIGERAIKSLSAFTYSIKNKDWESTVSVDRNDVEDDNLGIYTPMVQGLASAAATHPDEIIFPLLHAGFSTLCYDLQYFFDIDHPVGSGTASNKGTGVLNMANYAAARTQMMSLTDEEDRPIGVIPDLLLVPPQLEKTALEICAAQRLANGQDNVYYHSAEVLVVSWLAANPTEWFLLDTKKPLKPFIFQRRKEPVFVAKQDPSDDNVFMKKEYVFGVDSRDNAGYGLWQLAYGSDGTQ